MTSIKKLTIQNLEDSSIRTQEIKDIHQKWGKYIDEGFGSISFWEYGSIFTSFLFGYLVFNSNNHLIIFVIGMLLAIFMYFWSKRLWFREGFYSGYDTGKNDEGQFIVDNLGANEALKIFKK